ncbi:MAG: phosphatidate cytidylyltransferase, partial [Alphaproteobacteria bacterium]
MTSPLARRIASAAVLAPIAIAAALAGPPAYAVLVGVFAAAMGWEWARLCMDGRASSRIVGMAVAAMLGTVLAAAAHGPDAGIIVALAGGVILGITLRRSAGRALLAGAGMGYLAVATVAVLAIRGPAEASPWPTLWLFAV